MEPGTALAVVSLSFQGFAACVKGFDLICNARGFGKDAGVERTKLIIQEHRLIEWARAVGVITPGRDRSLGHNEHPAALVLLQLEQLLVSTDNLKQRYKLELANPQDRGDGLLVQEISVRPEDSASSVLSSIVAPETRREILANLLELEGATRFPRHLRWAAFDKNKYAQLINDITALIDGLWCLLDISNQVQTSRAVNQTLQLTIQTSQDVKQLHDLQKALCGSSIGSEHCVERGLAASAGLKAQHVLLAPDLHQTSRGMACGDGRTIRRARMLEPSLLKNIDMPSSSAIGSALYQGVSVLIEEKHVQPKMKAKLRSRVEALVRLLSEPPSPSFRTFPCLGYTEEQTGFRLVFRLADNTQKPESLHRMLSKPGGLLPDVGTRLRLASRVCQTLLSFHTAEWYHKDVRSENIILARTLHEQPADLLGQPYLCGFSFARQDSPTEISEQPTSDVSRDIYRHPNALGEVSEGFERYMDAYSLGCVLVEIADWAPLRKIIQKHGRIDFSGESDVKLTDIASLDPWLHDRYITKGVAEFRLGTAFMEMLSLCIPGSGEPASLADFYSALENMMASNI